MTSDGEQLEWALPGALAVPPAALRERIDVYQDNIMLYILDKGFVTALNIAPEDLATAILGVTQSYSGILPEGTLWSIRKEAKTETAIYQPPRKRHIAVVVKPLEPPERFTIPVPGLIFVCSPSEPPRVYAVKSRPQTEEWPLFAAPFFNTFPDGKTCAGTNKYPQNVIEIPDAFFACFFSLAQFNTCSRRHKDSLITLYRELEGQKEYPGDDLVEIGKLAEVI